jgi:hypothetical protein
MSAFDYDASAPDLEYLFSDLPPLSTEHNARMPSEAEVPE